MEFVPANVATCEEDGNIAYYSCKKCSKLYEDEAGEKEYTVEEVVEKATGHIDYKKEWKSNDESHWYECSCGEKVSINTHEFEWIIDKPATEDETGLKHEKCKVCEYKRNENTVIDKLSHTHSMKKTEAKASSCTKEGNIVMRIQKHMTQVQKHSLTDSEMQIK